jgi:hypothetical protein
MTSSPTTATDARLVKLPNTEQEISGREQRCVRQAVNRSNDQIAQIEATPDALTSSQTQRAKDDRDRAVSECSANADREKAQLSARERAEYESQAREERDRAGLMTILITSRPR